VKAMPLFWTPAFVFASVVVFAVYVIILAQHWQPFAASIALLYSPSRMTLELLLLSYACFTATAIVHELGHGLTCKRFGGEVHEIGAMVLYFAPAFYCNVSDAWTFSSRTHRLWVTFAGGWIQLWCAAIATVVWLLTEPGTFVNTAALFTGALGGAFSLLFNYNPLIPLDGYYALIDWLELPNLRARAFAFIGSRFRRVVLRLDAPVAAVTDRERRIFLTYGILAGTYTTLILGLTAFLAGRWLSVRFGAWGLALFSVLVFRLTAKPRAAAARLARAVLSEKLPRLRPGRAAVMTLAGVLILAATAAWAPWTMRATGTAVVEPQARRWLRPPEGARLREVLVRSGAPVRTGDTIAVLRQPELELERIALLTVEQQLGTRAARARATGDGALERAAAIELETVRHQLDAVERRRSALVLRAPFNGIFVTPRLEERLGEEVAAGDSLVEVWAQGELRARIYIPERAAGEIATGADLRIRFPARPSVTWRAQVERVESATDGQHLIATAVLPHSAEHPLLPGMQGRARVNVAHTTVARALERAARRVVRLDFLL
ncbi:MAG TPA: efflux RND transporter periplasmic adaptor subunit, partial [Longimicrobiales bacterium]|nr:efflux RND transporter periplasmic adaptor subunit [Longimicrobiales bacterium]